MKKLLVFPLFLLLIACSPNAEDILKGSYEKCQSVKNGYYEMEKYVKMIGHDDTIKIDQTGYFSKIDDHSLDPYLSFRFRSYYSSPQRVAAINVFYNGDTIVIYTDSGGQMMSKNDRAKDIWMAYGKNPVFSTYLPITYNDSRPLPDSTVLASPKTTVSFVKEEAVNGVLCYHIKMVTSPEFDYSTLDWYMDRVEYNYWISKQDSIPIQLAITRDLHIDGLQANFFEKYILTKYELNRLSEQAVAVLTIIPPDINLYEDNPYGKKIDEAVIVGSIVPDWSLVSLNGDTLKLQNLRGELVLIDFFYTSCPPCIGVLPALQNLYDTYKDKGLRVVGISSVELDTKEILERFVERYRIGYPILSADLELADLYSVSAYPTTFLIGKDGKLLFKHAGGYDDSAIEKLESIINTHIAGK